MEGEGAGVAWLYVSLAEVRVEELGTGVSGSDGMWGNSRDPKCHTHSGCSRRPPAALSRPGCSLQGQEER